MRIGIISDTHDRLELIDNIVRRLNEEKLDLVLHAGDYIAPFVVERFRPLNMKMIGVLGNNDAERTLLTEKFKQIDKQITGKFAEIIADGLKIALLHGEEDLLLNSIIKTGYYDVVVHGHTHRAEIRREGNTVIVNPGEVCGYLSNQSTYAILNTEPFDVKICLIDK